MYSLAIFLNHRLKSKSLQSPKIICEGDQDWEVTVVWDANWKEMMHLKGNGKYNGN